LAKMHTWIYCSATFGWAPLVCACLRFRLRMLVSWVLTTMVMINASTPMKGSLQPCWSVDSEGTKTSCLHAFVEYMN
jgi:hypothetical protein